MPTVSGVVTDKSGTAATWSASWAVASSVTAYGACPHTSGASGVLSKYGPKASVRIFNSGGFGSAVSRPSTSVRVHVSWKPTLGGTVTNSQLVTAFANLQDGDLVEVWHEADVKHRNGSQNLASMLSMKNQFHAKVAALRGSSQIAQVRTVNTWAGWSVDSTSSVNPQSPSLHADADILGIDMDGIPAQENFYPYFARQMGTKFVTAYNAGGYTGWTVPEFTMPSVASDPDRTRRIAWFQSEVDKIEEGVPASGISAPLMIAWFDTAGIIGDTERLTASNEINAWSALVATN